MTFQQTLIDSLETNRLSIAIESGGVQITAEQLLSSANHVTAAILRKGIAHSTIIGIDLANRVDVITAMIGVVNARCTFVLIDRGLPPSRLSMMLGKMKLEHLITDSIDSESSPLDRLEHRHLFVSMISGSSEFVRPGWSEDDDLYIYFTSGSTGAPKGIVGRNGSLLQFIQWEIREFELKNTRTSQLINPYFDAFLRDVFVPLISGGTICIPAQYIVSSPIELTEWLDNSRIQLIHCVPSVFRLFKSAKLTGSFSHLRYIMLSGERIIAGELSQWYSQFGTRIQLVNFYGLTETTMIRFFHRIQPADVNAGKIPVGVPIAGTDFMVAGDDLKPCPKLVAGELYIVSPFLAKGYLNDPQLTDERFIKLGDGRLAFKTGDSARVMPDGRVDLLGRRDRQIKLAGIRIELDDIENIIRGCSFIDAVAVTDIRSEEISTDIIALIVPKKSHTRLDEIYAFIEAELPKFMVPSKVVFTEKLPLLSNGKVDYKKVPELIPGSSSWQPTTDIEKKLQDIWEEVLEGKVCAPDVSFLRMGGTSLRIMKLIGKVYQQFGVRVSLNDIFQNLTLEKQLALIARSQKTDKYKIHRSEIKKYYHLSLPQEQVYVVCQLNKDHMSYNMPCVWKVNSLIEKDKISEVLRKLVARHESLRSRFCIVDGHVMQTVEPAVSFDVVEINGSDDDPASAVENFIKPFDLGSTPLFRVAIIRARSGDAFLVWDIHHLVCDGLSQVNLFSDFLRLYRGEELLPLLLQQKDYAEWEYAFRSADDYWRQRQFWLQQFEFSLPALDFHKKYEKITSDHGSDVQFSISHSEISSLIDITKSEDITMNSVLMSVYMLFLADLTGCEDIPVGAVSTGRMGDDLDYAVGMFVKILPLRYKIDKGLSYHRYLLSLNKYLFDANSNSIYDISDVLNELNATRTDPVRELFQAVLAVQNFDVSFQSNGDFQIYSFKLKSSKYPLTLYATPQQDRVDFKLEYSAAYFTNNDAELMSESLSSLFNRVARNIHGPIDDFMCVESKHSHTISKDVLFNFENF